MHMFENEARAYAQTHYNKDVEWLSTWRDFEIYRETNRGPVFVRFERTKKRSPATKNLPKIPC